MNTKEQINSEIYHLSCKFTTTVHTALPIRTASQGVSFALKNIFKPYEAQPHRVFDFIKLYSRKNIYTRGRNKERT